MKHNPMQLAVMLAIALGAAPLPAGSAETKSGGAAALLRELPADLLDGGLSVRVSLSPALAAKAGPDDVVFVFARAAQGPKMPLAIQRLTVRQLPATVRLDDSRAMTPELKLSAFKQVVVGARVAKSGEANAQAGDFEGLSATLDTGKTRSTEVMINKVVAASTTARAHAPAPARKRGPATVNVPPSVKATWKRVELSVAAGTAAAETLRLAIGEERALGSSGLRLRVLAYLPAFQHGHEGVITSSSNEPQNPAVQVRVSEAGKTLAEGWVFQNYPDLKMLETNRVQVRLLAAHRD